MFAAPDAGPSRRGALLLAAATVDALMPVSSRWSSADDGRGVVHRYAIVAATDVQATGLGDLLVPPQPHKVASCVARAPRANRAILGTTRGAEAVGYRPGELPSLAVSDAFADD